MNNIGLITKFSTDAWDKVYKRDAISSILDANKELMKFTGVKTVRIAKYASDGLGNYGRANKPVSGNYAAFTSGTPSGQGYGYPEGDASLEWEEFTLRMDRAKQLRIELFDNEETGGLVVAATMADFSRTKVVPEVDAYVFSELARLAGTVKDTTSNPITPSAGSIGYNANGPLAALTEAFEALMEAEVPEEDQVVFCSIAFWGMLQKTNELVRTLHQNEYKENVSFTIGEYAGRKIIAVPETRFRTKFETYDNGYGWGEGSKKINFIACSKKAVTHVVKYDKVKVYEPGVVQDYDGYKVNVRIYHDVFVPDNKRVAIYASVADGTPKSATIKFIANTVTEGAKVMLTNIAVVPGDLMIDGLYVAATAPAVGTALTSVVGATAVAAYAPLPASLMGESASSVYLFAVRKGVVIAVNSTDAIAIPAAA